MTDSTAITPAATMIPSVQTRTGLEDADLALTRLRVAELARRARRIGRPEPTIVVDRVYSATRVLTLETGAQETVTTARYDVTIHGEVPVLEGGWEVVGRVDHVGTTNVVAVIDGIDPEAYRTAENVCDHCGTRRARKETVLVRGTDGSIRRVGKSCLSSFVGDGGFWVYAAIVLLEDTLDRDTVRGTASPADLERDFVAAAWAIHYHGFVPSSGDTPTRATMGGFGNPKIMREAPMLDPIGGFALRALRYWANLTPTSDFERNVAAIVTGDTYKPEKHRGYVAAAVNAYKKHVEGDAVAEARAAERTAREAAREAAEPCPVGKVQISGIVVSTSVKDTDYGSRRVMTVEDDRGFRVWGTNTGSDVYNFADAGDRITFLADVTRSDRDEKFGFFKRPTRVEITPALEETAR